MGAAVDGHKLDFNSKQSSVDGWAGAGGDEEHESKVRVSESNCFFTGGMKRRQLNESEVFLMTCG